jgi:hypothetical protein
MPASSSSVSDLLKMTGQERNGHEPQRTSPSWSASSNPESNLRTTAGDSGDSSSCWLGEGCIDRRRNWKRKRINFRLHRLLNEEESENAQRLVLVVRSPRHGLSEILPEGSLAVVVAMERVVAVPFLVSPSSLVERVSAVAVRRGVVVEGVRLRTTSWWSVRSSSAVIRRLTAWGGGRAGRCGRVTVVEGIGVSAWRVRRRVAHGWEGRRRLARRENEGRGEQGRGSWRTKGKRGRVGRRWVVVVEVPVASTEDQTCDEKSGREKENRRRRCLKLLFVRGEERGEERRRTSLCKVLRSLAVTAPYLPPAGLVKGHGRGERRREAR